MLVAEHCAILQKKYWAEERVATWRLHGLNELILLRPKSRAIVCGHLADALAIQACAYNPKVHLLHEVIADGLQAPQHTVCVPVFGARGHSADLFAFFRPSRFLIFPVKSLDLCDQRGCPRFGPVHEQPGSFLVTHRRPSRLSRQGRNAPRGDVLPPPLLILSLELRCDDWNADVSDVPKNGLMISLPFRIRRCVPARADVARVG
mmetsp:Transcript_6445/g.19051  ORF Transcript_6445/g.19051 Transcript_6445/m.19051 type:complete len:205 (-) Transcript_6445:622-1236(-)